MTSEVEERPRLVTGGTGVNGLILIKLIIIIIILILMILGSILLVY